MRYLLLLALAASSALASTGDDDAFQEAFRQVRVGMTYDQVTSLGQVGDQCAYWPHQRPPVCGPLHYFADKRATETARGTIETYWYGPETIVYRNGVVVLIHH